MQRSNRADSPRSAAGASKGRPQVGCRLVVVSWTRLHPTSEILASGLRGHGPILLTRDRQNSHSCVRQGPGYIRPTYEGPNGWTVDEVLEPGVAIRRPAVPYDIAGANRRVVSTVRVA